MPIIDNIDNLRKKPRQHRVMFAFLSSFGITLLIFSFWSISVFNKFSGDADNTIVLKEETQNKKEYQSALATVKNSTGEILNIFSTQFSSLKNKFFPLFSGSLDFQELYRSEFSEPNAKDLEEGNRIR